MTRIDAASMANRIGLYLQRNISEAQVIDTVNTVTANLNNGAAMEVRGHSVRVQPLRVRQMLASMTVNIPAGQGAIALPDAFLDGNEITSDRTEFEQVPLRRIAWEVAKYSDAGTPPGDQELRSGPRPLLAFTGTGYQTFSYEPTEVTIWYWRELTHPINGRVVTLPDDEFDALFDHGRGNGIPYNRRNPRPAFVPETGLNSTTHRSIDVDDNFALILEPDIYFKGVAAYIAQESQDDEKKNEQWIAFKGSVDALNASQSENSGTVGPRRVYRRMIGGKR